jgi:AraC-like DNA-binding protein
MAAGTDVQRAWKPPIAGVREVFHARFREHAYPPHTHDVWTILIVDDGAVRYDLDRHAHAADNAQVTVLPPFIVHDGRPATEAGFRKRVLYLETSLLSERLIGAAVDRPVMPDVDLRGAVAMLHDTLGCAEDLLEAETRLAFVSERIGQLLGEPAPAQLIDGADVADELRAYLDTHAFEPVKISAAAAAIGSSPTGVARAFSRTFGIAPHTYLLGRRMEAARDRILRGQPLADVAAEVGFVDQAHLTRRFGQFLGTTPGRFRGVGAVT